MLKGYNNPLNVSFQLIHANLHPTFLPWTINTHSQPLHYPCNLFDVSNVCLFLSIMASIFPPKLLLPSLLHHPFPQETLHVVASTTLSLNHGLKWPLKPS